MWAERGALRLPPSPQVPLLMVGPGTGVAPFRAFLQHRQAALLAGEQPRAVWFIGAMCLHSPVPHHCKSAAVPPAPTSAAQRLKLPLSGCPLQCAGEEPPPAPCTLFFGCRNKGGDFYFRGEWEEMQRQGVLAAPPGGLHTAFSRDHQQEGGVGGSGRVYVQQRIREQGAEVWRLLQQEGAWVYVAGSADKMPSQVAAALEEAAVQHGGLDPAAAAALLRRMELSGRYQVEAWS